MDFSRLLRFKKIISIELIIMDTGYQFNVVEVEIVKNRLRINPQEFSSNGIDDFVGHLKKEIPVCLTISGKGILIKQIQLSENIINAAIKASFMLNTLDDYIFQHSESQNEKIWTCIIRKEIVVNILDKFKKQEIQVVDLLIGPISVVNLTSIISSDSFQTSYYKITFSDMAIKEITNMSYHIVNYQIGEKIVEGKDIIALASAYALLINNNSKPISSIPDIICQNNDFKVNRAISSFYKYGLVLVFLVLLLNFLIFSHYNEKVNDYNVQSLETKNLLAQRDSLIKELKEREDIYNRIGFNELGKIAYFADSIAASKPGSILFDEMFINPAVIDEYGKKLSIDKQTVRIKGESVDASQINSWLDELSKVSWIDSLKINEMKYSNAKRKIDFRIQFKISDDNLK